MISKQLLEGSEVRKVRSEPVTLFVEKSDPGKNIEKDKQSTSFAMHV